MPDREERQFEAADQSERSLAIEAGVAWRGLGLTFQSREKPHLSCEAFLEPDAWPALYVFTKRGGYLGRQGDGPPGSTVMWRGLERLADITLAWQILNYDNSQDI